MKVAALCAGYGGLELGLQQAGVDVTLSWYAETDRHASQVMAHHHPDAPNLGDLTAITDPPPVDIVTAGFPCQPVSMAGKRKGITDERWLIDDVCRVARNTGADWLILENVAGLLTANGGDAMARVVSALAENGFDARWTCVRASDVGAPHQRLRWFCIADTMRVGEFEDQDGGGRSDSSRKPGGFRDGGGNVADANDGRRQQRDQSIGRLSVAGTDRPQPVADADGGGHGGTQNGGRVEHLDGSDERPSRVGQRSRQVAEHRSSSAPDAERQRTQIPSTRQQPAVEMSGSVGTDRSARWGQYAEAVARWEPIVGRAAPDPTDDRRRLNPRFVEWMMGLPDGWVTDAVDGRSHQLRILGNGVVPQQAAHALTVLNGQP